VAANHSNIALIGGGYAQVKAFYYTMELLVKA